MVFHKRRDLISPFGEGDQVKTLESVISGDDLQSLLPISLITPVPIPSFNGWHLSYPYVVIYMNPWVWCPHAGHFDHP